jgi:hypothetical protein
LVPDDLFERSFGKAGNALLVAHSPLVPAQLRLSEDATETPPPAGPRLQTSRSMLLLGRLHRRKWEGSLIITNAGNEPLRIERADVACPECVASVESEIIAPGENSTLRATGSAMQMGAFTEIIELTTNQPGQKVVRIPVRGYLEPPVAFERPAAELGDLLPGQPAEMSVPFVASSDLTAEQLQATAPASAPLVAEVRAQPDGNAALNIRFKGDQKVGSQRHIISVTARRSEDAVPTLFQVTVVVRPEASVFPESALVRQEEWDSGWRRSFQVDLHSSLHCTLTAEWSEHTLETVVPVTCRSIGNGRWSITIRSTGGSRHEGEHALVIRYGNGKSLRLPVYFGEGALSAKH